MSEEKNSVSGEGVVTATTVEEMKADFLNKVERMYNYVKAARDDFKIKRFFQFLNEMIRIANEIEKKGLMEDEIMYNVWDLITDFDDDVTNEMPIGSAQDYLEIRLSDIIAALQGEEVVVGGY